MLNIGLAACASRASTWQAAARMAEDAGHRELAAMFSALEGQWREDVERIKKEMGDTPPQGGHRW